MEAMRAVGGSQDGMTGIERQAELRAADRDREATEDAAQRNRDFSQVYSLGWRRIRELADYHPGAVKLYALLAEHIDGTCGAVQAPHKVLATLLGVSERTVRRLGKALEEAGAVVRIQQEGGGALIYALNPAEVWKSWDNRKGYAAFNTKTLISATAARRGEVRLRALIDGKTPKTHPDLFKDEENEGGI